MKAQYLDAYKKELALGGPAVFTRSQSQSVETVTKPSTMGSLQKGEVTDNLFSCTSASPTCQISVSGGIETINVSGRCDDGSYDRITSERLAENLIVKLIGRMTAMKPVIVQMSLKQVSKAASFTFSRFLVVPRTIIHLAPGQLALVNVSFLSRMMSSRVKISLSGILFRVIYVLTARLFWNKIVQRYMEQIAVTSAPSTHSIYQVQ